MEHASMLTCRHTEADQLGPICLCCGRADLPDPSYIVIALAVILFGAHVVYWINL